MNTLLCISLVLLPALAAAGLHERSPLQGGWATQHELTFKIYQPFKFSVYLHEHKEGLAKLKHHALAASTPTDPQYRDHLTLEQINALTAPSNVAWEAVSSWLSTELPAANVTREGSHFDVVSSVGDVSQLFSTQFEVLVNINTEQAVLRANAYTVPEHIEGRVATIFGLHGLPLSPRKSIVGSAGDYKQSRFLCRPYPVVQPNPVDRSCSHGAYCAHRLIHEGSFFSSGCCVC